MDPRIVLASASPRRRELLEAAGIAVRIVPSTAAEALHNNVAADALVQENAACKAAEVAARVPEAFVIGADTLVVLDGDVLGKPRDPGEARNMLRRLQGREHDVVTGLALIHTRTAPPLSAVERTRVRFAPLSAAAIDAYLAAFDPLDKAGAYAVQGPGALVIEAVFGCYYNVVGLPLQALERLFNRLGHSLLCDPEFRRSPAS